MMKKIAGIACLSLLLGLPVAAADIAVVVHPDVGVEGVSFAELRKIMRGDQQFWSDGKPVTLLVRAPTADERTLLLASIYEMSEAQFKQYWIAKVFRAETSSGPKIVLSNEMAGGLLKLVPGAVALIDAADVVEGLKVLAVDGKKPGDEGYPLHSGS